MNKESTPSKTKTITYYKPTPVLASYPPQYKHPDGTIKLYPPEPEVDFQIKVPVDEQESEKILKASIISMSNRELCRNRRNNYRRKSIRKGE